VYSDLLSEVASPSRGRPPEGPVEVDTVAAGCVLDIFDRSPKARSQAYVLIQVSGGISPDLVFGPRRCHESGVSRGANHLRVAAR
jgi:hypothetical protein